MADFTGVTLAPLMAEDMRTLEVQRTGGGEDPVGLRIAAAFRSRLLFLLIISSLGLGLVGYLLAARFIGPLRVLGQKARDVADGRLDVTFPEAGPDDVAELGAALNQIAANYQEVLLLTGTTVGKLKGIVGKMDAALQDRDASSASQQLPALVSAMDDELDTLVDIVRCFEYFQTSFDGVKVLGEPPAKK
jgi:methyl-accepting chemotaxis protein